MTNDNVKEIRNEKGQPFCKFIKEDLLTKVK